MLGKVKVWPERATPHPPGHCGRTPGCLTTRDAWLVQGFLGALLRENTHTRTHTYAHTHAHKHMHTQTKVKMNALRVPTQTSSVTRDTVLTFDLQTTRCIVGKCRVLVVLYLNLQMFCSLTSYMLITIIWLWFSPLYLFCFVRRSPRLFVFGPEDEI